MASRTNDVELVNGQLRQPQPAPAPAPAPAAAPPSALSAATAPQAAPDYMALYQQGLQQAKSGISQRLQGDLGYIQQQQGLAGQAIGQLPGGINAAYGQAQTSDQNAENAITAAQKSSGVGSLMPLGSYMAPVNAAIAGTQTADLQNVPLLQVAASQQADQERAAAMQGASQDQSALQAQQQDFYNQMAQQQAAAKASTDQSNGQALQNFVYSKKLQDDPNKNYGPNPSTTVGSTPITDKNGQPLGYTANDITAAKKSPTFDRASQELTNAQSPAQQAQVWHELSFMYRNQPALLASLASTFPNGQPPPDPGPVAAANAHYFGLDLSGTPLSKLAFRK